MDANDKQNTEWYYDGKHIVLNLKRDWAITSSDPLVPGPLSVQYIQDVSNNEFKYKKERYEIVRSDNPAQCFATYGKLNDEVWQAPCDPPTFENNRNFMFYPVYTTYQAQGPHWWRLENE